jgi:uncharacterized membrane protein YiaA
MDLSKLSAYMIVGGSVAIILVGVSYLFVGFWNESLLGLVAAVAILVCLLGGVVLFVLQAIFGIAREW